MRRPTKRRRVAPKKATKSQLQPYGEENFGAIPSPQAIAIRPWRSPTKRRRMAPKYDEAALVSPYGEELLGAAPSPQVGASGHAPTDQAATRGV